MGQEDEFYDEKLNQMKYGGGIWNLLASVMHVGVVCLELRRSCRTSRRSGSWGVAAGCYGSRRIFRRFWISWTACRRR